MTKSPILRMLAASTLVNTLGNGLFVTVSALFFTRSVGLSAAQVGLGMAVGSGCGVLAGIPLGHLADRYGARRMMIWMLLGEAVAELAYTQVRSLAAFLVTICVVTCLDQGGRVARNALIGDALPPEDRVRGRAFLRVVTNVGMGSGAALAAVALAYGTREAYVAVIVANAVTFLVTALLSVRLPDTRPERAADEPTRMRTDLPYLVITVLNGIFMLQAGVLEIGMPLWAIRHTHAPKEVVSAAFLVNTVMVILLQVRFSRGTEEPHRAARACLWAGVAMAVACVAYGLSGGRGAIVATGVLMVAIVAHTVAEMISSAGGWALSYELAAPGATGAYQGVFNAGLTVGTLLAPLVVASTALRSGTTGWLLLAAVFLASGAAIVPATRWAVTASAQPSPALR